MLYIRSPTVWHYRLFPEKILVTRIVFLIFYLSPNVAPKPTDQSCSNLIFKALLQLSPAHPFHFWPTPNIKGTLMLRVVHIRNKKRNDKNGILQTWSIVFVAMLLNHKKGRQESTAISHQKYTAYRKKISLKLGYRAVNARKYVRCALTFYFFLSYTYLLIYFLVLQVSVTFTVGILPNISWQVHELPRKSLYNNKI